MECLSAPPLLSCEWGWAVCARRSLSSSLQRTPYFNTSIHYYSTGMAAAGAGVGPAPVPAPARTLFRMVGGGPGPTLWDLVHDSPIITALPFVDWSLNLAGSHREGCF